MSRYNHLRPITNTGRICFALVILGCIALLVTFMPRTNDAHLDYAVGRPWYDNPIIAPETFPLLKSDSLYKADLEHAMRSYKPIYEQDPQVQATQTQAFAVHCRNKLQKTIPATHRRYLQTSLQTIYASGIIPSESLDSLQAHGCKSITISQGTAGRTVSVSKLLTPKTAYEQILNSADTTRYSIALLRSAGLSEYLQPDLTFNSKRSQSILDDITSNVSRYKGEVLAGQEIVRRGQIVDEHTALVLLSLETFYMGTEKQTTGQRVSGIMGHVLYVTIIAICLFLYFRQFRRDYLSDARIMSFIILMMLLFPIVTYLLVRSISNVYIPLVVPYAIMPIFMRVFLDSRTAYTCNVACAMLCTVGTAIPFEFCATEIVAGLVAIYSMRQLTQRSELLMATIFVTIASLLCYLCFDLMNMTLFTNSSIEAVPYLFILGNGLLLLISYLLLIPVERVFHFTSNVTLVELSNTNNPLLRRLSEEAPGTFQHSMQVANLASEVALRLGAKSQLVRTGALYHDIGKLINPIYFTENQKSMNPHDGMGYRESAALIISHVREGLELAHKHRLPRDICQFIATHHGRSQTKYFFISYENAHPHEYVDPKPFTYPGPNPSTVEQAILMMADSIEAASRSLKEYTDADIDKLVDGIINDQVNNGFFSRCPITFSAITEAKQIFKDKLKIIYHTRIAYPEKKQD